MLHDGNTWKVINRMNYINYEDYMRNQLEDDLIKVACYEGKTATACAGT
jgi:hypothetical protein